MSLEIGRVGPIGLIAEKREVLRLTNAWGQTHVLMENVHPQMDGCYGDVDYTLETYTRGNPIPQIDNGGITNLEAGLSAKKKIADKLKCIYAAAGSSAIFVSIFTLLASDLKRLPEITATVILAGIGTKLIKSFDRSSRIATETDDKLNFLKTATHVIK